MRGKGFTFKQFHIDHSKCAMKVGTDGCLLGGWFNCSHSRRILDIGCGSGLIALMAAQRCGARITGVEIDPQAAAQARININNSPWSVRVEIVCADILEFASYEPFDTIVSNPPYFVNSLKCDDNSRTLARHSDSLGCSSFFAKAKELLTPDGRVSIVIPCDILGEWRDAAALKGFSASRIAYIKTTPRKAAKRALVEFKQALNCELEKKELVLEVAPGQYSKEVEDILRDFYLKIL